MRHGILSVGAVLVSCIHRMEIITQVSALRLLTHLLCIETGAMLEAHKFNEKVTHCMCLVRKDEKSPYQILSPCGICQERLRYWGEDVQVAVTTEEEKIKFVQLKELQPYKAYPVEELEHWNE